MPSGVQVRPFRGADADSVHSLLGDLTEERGLGLSPMVARPEFRQHFSAYVNAVTAHGRGAVFVAEKDGRIVGAALGQARESEPWEGAGMVLEVRGIVVSPEHRGHGMARKLIEALQDWARGNKIQRFETLVRTDRPDEIKALEGLGFKAKWVRMWRPLE